MRHTLSGMLRSVASVVESSQGPTIAPRKYLKYHSGRVAAVYLLKEQKDEIEENETKMAALFTTAEERSQYESTYRRVHWGFPLVGMSYAAWDTINDRRDCTVVATIKMTLGTMGGLVFAHLLPVSIYTIPFGLAVAATSYLRRRRFQK